MMDSSILYTIAIIVHILCAIIFLGYIFTDVVIIPTLNKKYQKEQYEDIKNTLGQKASTIMPKALLAIIITGVIMLSAYMNADVGYNQTNMQLLLLLKMVLGFGLGLMVLYSIMYRKMNNKPHPTLKKYIHKIALGVGIVIVLIAKVMFVVY